MSFNSKKVIQNFDERRNVALPGNYEQTLDFCVEYFFERALEAIEKKGFFTIALSGGSTPKAILKKLTQPHNIKRLDWKKVYFFFGDERCVPPDHNDSNYKMAMNAALAFLKVPQKNIFRMVAESNAEKNAEHYAILISEKVPEGAFDLITLGMGEDGHTASLFPNTEALKVEDRWVTVNHVPQKQTQRMTLTYPIINRAHHICFFVLGPGKSERVASVLKGSYNPLQYPSQKIGTEESKALWILDNDAAAEFKKS